MNNFSKYLKNRTHYLDRETCETLPLFLRTMYRNKKTEYFSTGKGVIEKGVGYISAIALKDAAEEVGLKHRMSGPYCETSFGLILPRWRAALKFFNKRCEFGYESTARNLLPNRWFILSLRIAHYLDLSIDEVWEKYRICTNSFTRPHLTLKDKDFGDIKLAKKGSCLFIL